MSSMDLKRAGIISNPNKDHDLNAAKLAAVSLRSRGVSVAFDPDAIPDGEKDIINYNSVQCLFVLGGDGTLLKAACCASRYDVPMLGINLGRLGFLTEIELAELDAAIDRIIKGDFILEKRLMLECTITEDDKETFKINALNEIAVLKKEIARTINVEICVNGSVADDVQCDGMLVSTPTGSTAYSLSAGGPVITPKLDCMLVTPVCPHSLHSRALIVAADDEIQVKPLGGCAALISDGVSQRDVAYGQAVSIKKSKYKASFIRFKDDYFFSLLKSKFLIWDK